MQGTGELLDTGDRCARASARMMLAIAVLLLTLLVAPPSAIAALSQSERDLKGSWFNPETSGQGVMIDVIEVGPRNVLFGSWYTYSVDGQQKLWFVLQGESTGTANQVVDIYTTENGRFNLPPVVESRRVGSAVIELRSPGELRIEFAMEDADLRWGSGGVLQLSRALDPVPLSTLDSQLEGTWFNPVTSGQGVQSDVIPGADGTSTLFMTWYTYAMDSGEQTWLVLQGKTSAGTSMVADVHATRNGRFNQPPVVAADKIGNALVRVIDAVTIDVEFVLSPDPRWPSGGIMRLSRSGEIAEVEVIDTHDRAAVTDAYIRRHLAPVPPLLWSGSVPACVAGNTSPQFQQRTIDQINYYRNMAGLSSVEVFADNARFMEAALVMSANDSLTHYPPADWRCYSSLAASGAASANLALLINGPTAIAAYIDDWGPANFPVGHRRWLFHPPTSAFATGDTSRSNALGVFVANRGGVATREFVAWPPAGFVPYDVLPFQSNRWSFSVVGGADFSGASVTVTNTTTGVSYEVLEEVLVAGYGEDTLVWQPLGFEYSRPARDQNIEVTIADVVVAGVSRSYQYEVTVIAIDQANGKAGWELPPASELPDLPPPVRRRLR